MAKHFDSDYQVRKAILAAIGGDATKHYHSVYDIDIAILEAVEGGGGGGVDWDTIKEKLSEEGVDSIKFIGVRKDFTQLTYLGTGGDGVYAPAFDPEYEFDDTTIVEIDGFAQNSDPSKSSSHPRLFSNKSAADWLPYASLNYTTSAVNVDLNFRSDYSTTRGTLNIPLTGESPFSLRFENNKIIDLTTSEVIGSGYTYSLDPKAVAFGTSASIAEKNTTILKFSAIRIYDGTQSIAERPLVKEFLPATVDGAVGFYETVEGRFYPVGWTIIGEEIPVSDDIILDYETLKGLIEGEVSNIINDESISTKSTWSSSKIDSILGDVNTALETIIGG